MKCYLSGMPELRLGLNDKVMFETTGRSELSEFACLFFWPFEMDFCSISWQVNRARGCQVPPMRTPVAV